MKLSKHTQHTQHTHKWYTYFRAVRVRNQENSDSTATAVRPCEIFTYAHRNEVWRHIIMCTRHARESLGHSKLILLEIGGTGTPTTSVCVAYRLKRSTAYTLGVSLPVAAAYVYPRAVAVPKATPASLHPLLVETVACIVGWYMTRCVNKPQHAT